MFYKKLFLILLPIYFVGITACVSSEPKVTEFLNSADSGQEIRNVDKNIKAAQLQKTDLLSPRNFKLAVDSLNSAKESRRQNLEQSVVLHKIALSQAYLDKANSTAGVTNQLLTGVMKERQDALAANADQYFPKEFEALDEELKVITMQIENADNSGVEKNHATFEAKYKALELNSIHQAKISPAQKNLQIAMNENNQLQSKAWFEEKYERAREKFSSDEAEVYKQGNKLLLRLKGLSFATSQFVISPENYSLLTKVQDVIKDFGSTEVVIEGHTDDTGSKITNKSLSAKRASAVESYFVANNIVSPSNIKSQGFGDDKPISSNKTELGRAENRRVDVIITPIENSQ